MDVKNWRDLETQALVDPYLHRCLHWEREVGRERALINTCLALSEERQRLHDRIVRILAESPSRVDSDRIMKAITT